jgi:hypothetical protein
MIVDLRVVIPSRILKPILLQSGNEVSGAFKEVESNGSGRQQHTNSIYGLGWVRGHGCGSSKMVQLKECGESRRRLRKIELASVVMPVSLMVPAAISVMVAPLAPVATRACAMIYTAMVALRC